MEYLEGIDLKSYIRKNGGSLDASEAVSITSKVVDALSVVHAEGVLHRDIAPDNIFICKNGDVKLIDFGAARFVLGEASKSLSVILKQGFAPPEQYHRKGNQGPWTDIYALGATLYFALTGKIIDDVMSRMEDDTLDMAGIPKELQPIIVKMLAVKYVERYQNTAELKAVFGKFKSSPIIPAAPALPKEEKNEKPTQKPAIPTANPPTATPENKKKKLLPLLIASLFLVVIVAVAAVFVLKGQDNDEVSVPVQGNVTLDNSPTPYNPIVEINPEEPSEAPENEPEADEPIENEPEEPTEQENPTEEPEEPKTEPESIEPPKAEEPKVEEPKVEEPKTDTPKEETPKEETKVEKPKEEAKIEPMGLKLSHTSVTLTEGESVTITATVEPSNATNKTVGWTSYNESVASVKNGVITAHKAGTTVITASVGTINVTCNVTVKAKNVAVTDITLDKTSVTLTEGETTTIKATVTPDNATDKTVTWSTSNELVASIFNQIAIYTLRRFAKTERSTPNISEAEIFCQQIMTYIDTHIYSLTKLSELSDQFGYNYTYISSLFKKTTGNTLLDYYCKRKLTIAQAMLNEGKFTIARIADKLGYSSPFAFSAAFKKAYGISPKKYKEAHKQ